jgi:predicted dehydrogenase
MRIKTGIYGSNGHQIHRLLENHAKAELVAVCAFSKEHLPGNLQNKQDVKYYETLDEMLKDPEIELVSLCSPVRAEQADDAVKCLRSGKHVYAEKPCALSEQDLDKIIKTAEETGKKFHEMAGTAFEQPYLSARELVKSGTLGTIVQVLAQKSYPYHDRRPQNELIDGGLTCQAGVHAARFIEHVAGIRIKDISAVETNLSNPDANGGLQIAASCMMRLENGGVAVFIANYLNPPTFGSWGNESLRIFGNQGFLEIVDGGKRTRLVLNERDMGEIKVIEPSVDYFDMFIDELNGGTMPLTLEDELHPTRMVIRAKCKIEEIKTCAEDM